MTRLNVTCALIIRDEKVLICQHDENAAHPKKWEFPGGKIEPGETAEQCILREIKEELNVKIAVEKAMIPVEYNYPGKQIRLIPFLCSIENGEPKALEHHKIEWKALWELVDCDFAEADKKLIVENRIGIKC